MTTWQVRWQHHGLAGARGCTLKLHFDHKAAWSPCTWVTAFLVAFGHFRLFSHSATEHLLQKGLKVYGDLCVRNLHLS